MALLPVATSRLLIDTGGSATPYIHSALSYFTYAPKAFCVAAQLVCRMHGSPLGARRPRPPLLLLLLIVCQSSAQHARLWGNRTTVECPEPAVSAETRANCTITTRDGDGTPTAGADAADFSIVGSEALMSPSSIWGGPIHWYVDLATCPAGVHNVTVTVAAVADVDGHAWNVSGEALVVAGMTRNFTLDCPRGRDHVVAGEPVVCLVHTLDGCANPTSTPWAHSASEWSVTRLGAALSASGSVLPYVDGVLLDTDTPSATYGATFETGLYWSEGMNYTERGVAGVSVSLSTSNWTASASSTVEVGPAALSAGATSVLCGPDPLLQTHMLTCLVRTADRFGNPQTGASPADFEARFALAESDPRHGSSAGALARTERADTFALSFAAPEPGGLPPCMAEREEADRFDRLSDEARRLEAARIRPRQLH